MGAFTYQSENASSVARSRLFKAFVLDVNNLLPKIMEGVKIEILEGNGGAGTLKKTTYSEGGETKYVVERVEAVDESNYVYNYSVVEGSALPEGVEKITFETKIEEAANGGSLGKASFTYFTKTDAPPSDDIIASAKAQGSGLFKAVEAYLLAHPEY
ncbi:hypothetical protein K1719_005904 [Acacia pycnantha]|nr:hypothetical protein K1719_005904 [Acacia pycnantha]